MIIYLRSILATLHPVVHIVLVNRMMDTPSVHVCKITSVHHLLVDLNVQLAVIVLQARHATMKDALILALALVDLMQDAMLSTIVRSVVVPLVSLVILLLDVTKIVRH